MNWLKKYFRSRMPYMEVHKAQEIKTKISLIYAVLGWNIIGLTVYLLFKEHMPKTPSDSVDYAKLLGVKNATVIKFSGIKRVAEYDINLTEEEIDDFHIKSKGEAKEENLSS